MKTPTANAAVETECSPAYRKMLRVLMPKVETHDERQKRWFDFLSARLPRETDVYRHLIEMKPRDSYTSEHCALIKSLFDPWWNEQLSKRRSAAGKTGGRPKKKKARKPARAT